MTVHCKACGQGHDLDEAKAARVKAARCVCGNVIHLQGPDPNRNYGKYELVKLLSASSTAEVWFARMHGVGGFTKQVAIKRLPAYVAHDPNVAAMLVREAKVTAYLNHPNIVAVNDLIKSDSEYFICMEYVAGPSLATVLQDCKRQKRLMPVHVAMFFVTQLLRGLTYAHTSLDPSVGPLLHRDICPHNLLITLQGTLKIVDYTIARALNEASNTLPGTVRGKLNYAGPERLRGGDANEHIDLFAAAATFYELLTCQTLFVGANPAALMTAIMACEVPALVRKDVPASVEQVMRRALHRDVTQRYGTSREFNQELNDAVAALPEETRLEQAAHYLAIQHPKLFAPTEIDTSAGSSPEPLSPVDTSQLIGIRSLSRVAQRKSRTSGAAAFVAATFIGAALGGAALLGWQMAHAPEAPFATTMSHANPLPFPSAVSVPSGVATQQPDLVVPPTKTPSSAVAAQQHDVVVAPTETPSSSAATQQHEVVVPPTETPSSAVATQQRDAVVPPTGGAPPLAGPGASAGTAKAQASPLGGARPTDASIDTALPTLIRCLHDPPPTGPSPDVEIELTVDSGPAEVGIAYLKGTPPKAQQTCIEQAVKRANFTRPARGSVVQVRLLR